MTPTKTLDNTISPYEAFNKELPDWSTMRTFGCDALIRIVTSNQRKGKDKTQLATYVGHRTGIKGWVFLTNKTKRLVTSSDATFYEGDWLPQGVQTLDALRPNDKPKAIKNLSFSGCGNQKEEINASNHPASETNSNWDHSETCSNTDNHPASETDSNWDEVEHQTENVRAPPTIDKNSSELSSTTATFDSPTTTTIPRLSLFNDSLTDL